jgi:hypothetical protein
MGTILPNQIPSMTAPLIDIKTGRINQTWFLFLYNIANEVLGTQNSTAAAQYAQLIADLDADADESDSLIDKAHIAALEKQSDDTVNPTLASVNQALMMAYDALEPVITLYGSSSTTAPSAGGAGALPATPKGYLTVTVNGNSQQMAYY